MEFRAELDAACHAARRAGALALRYQAEGLNREEKSDRSPVTQADRESEKLIVSYLSELFPADGFLGEEGTSQPSNSGRRWIIDPIDGTRDFIRGNKLWSVLIGLEQDDQVIVGVCFLPATGDLFYAVRRQGAFRNSERVHASAISSASEAVLCVNGFSSIQTRPFAANLVPWMARFWSVRSLGGCTDAMMLASGQVDVWLENIAAPWDLAPLKVILEEAGAVFRNFDGQSSIYGGNCLAYVPALEAEVWALFEANGLA